MCYMLIGGKNVFEKGLMMGGHNDDLNGYEAASLELYPHRIREAGESITLPTGPVIPTPGETARCIALKTFRGDLAGDTIAINEHNVCLMGGENLLMDRNERAAAADPLVENGVAGGVRFVALMQSRTARECVERIGRYYTEYGNKFPCAVGVFDTEEAWYIEGGGGTTWLAVRVPDDCYLIQSNGYRINEVDWDDTENVLYSEGLREFVIEKGLWNPAEGPFNWARTFGRRFLEDPSTYYYNSRRIWSGLRLLSPSAGFGPDEEEYPTFVKPDQPITREKIMELLRDCNGDNAFRAFTEQGVENAVRPIGVPHCIHSAVAELSCDRPVELGGVLWSCLGSPLAAPYLPHHFGISRIAPEMEEGSDSFSKTSAFWNFRELMNLASADFYQHLPELSKEWSALEDRALAFKPAVEKQAAEAWESDPEKAAEILTAWAESLDYEALKTADRLRGALNRKIAGSLYRRFAKGSLEW